MYLLLVTCYLLLFVFLAWRKLSWAIYLIVFALPSYLIRFKVGFVPMTLLEGMILILFAVWLVKKAKSKKLSASSSMLNATVTSSKLWAQSSLLKWPIALFLVAATISVFISSDFQAAAGIWKAYFIEPILFFIVFVSTIKKEQIKNIFLFLGFSIFLLSLITLYQKFTGFLIPNPFWQEEATRRVTSVYGYPNAIGLFFAPIITLFIGLLITAIKNQPSSRAQVEGKSNIKNKKFVICYLLFVICLGILSIVFARSKGAFLALLAGLIFYAIFYKGYRKIFTGILIIFILVFLYFYILGGINLSGQATVEGGKSWQIRREIWSESLKMLKDRPIFGAGLSGYQAAIKPYHQKEYLEIYLYPHNLVLNFWGEVGILGLISVIWLLVLFYKTGFKTIYQSLTNHQSPVILMASMTTLLAHGLVDVPYFKNDLSVLFWVLVGSMVVLNRGKPANIGVNE